MNKRIVEEMLSYAYDFLKDCKSFNKEGSSKSTYKGYAAAFGAAIIMSGHGAASAFYEKKSNSDEDKTVITRGVLEIIKKTHDDNECYKSLYEYIKKHGNTSGVKEDIENAVIALKLAMNLFDLGYSKKDNDNTEVDSGVI